MSRWYNGRSLSLSFPLNQVVRQLSRVSWCWVPVLILEMGALLRSRGGLFLDFFGSFWAADGEEEQEEKGRGVITGEEMTTGRVEVEG